MATEVAATTKRVPARVVEFFNEVRDEMKKVTWPDRPQIQQATIQILVFVLVIGAVIALVDVVLQQVLVRFIPSLFSGR